MKTMKMQSRRRRLRQGMKRDKSHRASNRTAGATAYLRGVRSFRRLPIDIGVGNSRNGSCIAHCTVCTIKMVTVSEAVKGKTFGTPWNFFREVIDCCGGQKTAKDMRRACYRNSSAYLDTPRLLRHLLFGEKEALIKSMHSVPHVSLFVPFICCR